MKSFSDKVGFMGLVVAVVAAIIAVTTPEIRQYFGLEKKVDTPTSEKSLNPIDNNPHEPISTHKNSSPNISGNPVQNSIEQPKSNQSENKQDARASEIQQEINNCKNLLIGCWDVDANSCLGDAVTMIFDKKGRFLTCGSEEEATMCKGVFNIYFQNDKYYIKLDYMDSDGLCDFFEDQTFQFSPQYVVEYVHLSNSNCSNGLKKLKPKDCGYSALAESKGFFLEN